MAFGIERKTQKIFMNFVRNAEKSKGFARQNRAKPFAFLLFFLFLPQPIFEIAISKHHDFPRCAVRLAGIDAGQRHTVEGVVLAGRINRHITEYQQISHFGYGVKAVITDDVPG